MRNPIKLILLLVVGGFAFGAINGGAFNALDFHNLNLYELEKFFDAIDLGPLNGPLGDMKEAIHAVAVKVGELLDMAKKSK